MQRYLSKDYSRIFCILPLLLQDLQLTQQRKVFLRELH